MDHVEIGDCFSPRNRYSVTLFSYQYWNSSTYSYREKPRPESGFLFVTQGKIAFSFGESGITAATGDLVFLPKGCHYETIVRPEFGETRDYLINFETAFPLAENAPDVPTRLFHAQDPQYLAMFELAMEKRVKNQLGEFGLNGFLLTLMENIIKDAKNRTVSQTERQMKKALELLSEGGDLSIAHIARTLGISESGFRSLFRKAYGESPSQYRMNIRINQAKYLLESTELTMRDIAETLGFYDEAYFCRCFRRHAGVSPRKYAQSKQI